MKTSDLGVSAMYRILKKAGADRVSDESAEELRRVLEDIGIEIAKNAVDMSKHAGRKTVKAEDVKLASKTSGKIWSKEFNCKYSFFSLVMWQSGYAWACKAYLKGFDSPRHLSTLMFPAIQGCRVQ